MAEWSVEACVRFGLLGHNLASIAYVVSRRQAGRSTFAELAALLIKAVAASFVADAHHLLNGFIRGASSDSPRLGVRVMAFILRHPSKADDYFIGPPRRLLRAELMLSDKIYDK